MDYLVPSLFAGSIKNQSLSILLLFCTYWTVFRIIHRNSNTLVEEECVRLWNSVQSIGGSRRGRGSELSVCVVETGRDRRVRVCIVYKCVCL